MKLRWIMKKQDGASAVEFAIILPLFLLIVFGAVEWGLYLFNDHIITDAGRRGARLGVLQVSPRNSESAIRDEVLNYTGSHLVTFGTQNTPSVTVPAICVTFGNDLEVNVSYNYHFLLLPALTAGKVSPSKTITARTVMKCE